MKYTLQVSILYSMFVERRTNNPSFFYLQLYNYIKTISMKNVLRVTLIIMTGVGIFGMLVSTDINQATFAATAASLSGLLLFISIKGE